MEIKLPFERNNYFWGKLLSAGDFQSEQKYFNEKRQLLNRLLHNYGILCGLKVVKADDRAVSVEIGAALDYRGREIIVETPLTKKLSLIDGFSYSSKKNYCYLCIEYDESSIGETHSLAAEGVQYNMTREGYRLFITYDEFSGGIDLYEDTQVIFKNSEVMITQTVPRYVTANNRFMIKINIKKFAASCGKIKLDYSLDSNYIKLKDGDIINISFDENNFKESDSYELYTMLRAASLTPQKDIIETVSLKVIINGGLVCDKPSGKWNVGIVQADFKDYIKEDYYKINMDDLFSSGASEKIYLAKIFYASGSSTYAIDKVINAPFKQYISNGIISDALSKTPETDKQKTFEYDTKNLEIKIEEILKSYVSLAKMQPLVKSGVETLDLVALKVAKNRCIQSKQVTHGLGQGRVCVILSLVTEDTVTYGDSSIFDTDSKNDISLAARVNGNGTFVIGARISNDLSAAKIKVKWTAIKCSSDTFLEIGYEKNLSINPDVVKLKCGESIKFRLNAIGINENESLWRVKEKDGGVIDNSGFYTAPHLPGIYEINVVNNGLEAKAFVIIT